MPYYVMRRLVGLQALLNMKMEATPSRGEALALKHGLTIVGSSGCRRVECELDCTNLVASLEKAERNKFLPIVRDIKIC